MNESLKELNLKKMGILITSRCTLKCKLCLAYIPYYKQQQDMGINYIQEALEKCFEIVNSVEVFTMSGGEPLMHPDILEIFKLMFQYENKITKSINTVINSTIKIPDKLLEFWAKKNDKIKIICSDYGDRLSPFLNTNVKNLENYNINYRVSKFTSDNMYYDGWLDFNDHSVKWENILERDKNASKCIQRIGRNLIIFDGEIHCCSSSHWRIINNIIPKIKGEYVELLNENISIEEKRQDLLTMLSLPSSSACACCPGFNNELPRHKPAEQLTNSVGEI